MEREERGIESIKATGLPYCLSKSPTLHYTYWYVIAKREYNIVSWIFDHGGTAITHTDDDIRRSCPS
jgi:hypothetical protein